MHEAPGCRGVLGIIALLIRKRILLSRRQGSERRSASVVIPIQTLA
jgi:hypothetical protein